MLFDRSWHNRAGIERVMGFCTKEEYGRFLHQCPMLAHLLDTIPYHEVQRLPLKLPPRPKSQGYVRAPRESQTFVPDYAASLS